MTSLVRGAIALALFVALTAPAEAGLFGKKKKQEGAAETSSSETSAPAMKKARRYNRIEWGNEWSRVFRLKDNWHPHYLEMF